MALREALLIVEQKKGDGLAIVVDALIEEAAVLLKSPISYFALMNKDN